MMGLPWWCPLAAWSALTVSLGCTCPRTGCERILIRGDRTANSSEQKKRKNAADTHFIFFFFFFRFWVYLARVPYSAPGWRWFGSGAGRVRASGRGCKLSPASFCRSLLLESVDGNLHNTHTCITLACCYAYFTRIYYCIVHLCRKSSGFIA